MMLLQIADLRERFEQNWFGGHLEYESRNLDVHALGNLARKTGDSIVGRPG